MDLHHPILREFPEHREIIRRLKGSDDRFRKMFDEYHRLDDAIYRIEDSDLVIPAHVNCRCAFAPYFGDEEPLDSLDVIHSEA